MLPLILSRTESSPFNILLIVWQLFAKSFCVACYFLVRFDLVKFGEENEDFFSTEKSGLILALYAMNPIGIEKSTRSED